jgi:hypothetical protein
MVVVVMMMMTTTTIKLYWNKAVITNEMTITNIFITKRNKQTCV